VAPGPTSQIFALRPETYSQDQKLPAFREGETYDRSVAIHLNNFVNSSYITEIQEVQNSKEAVSYAAVSGYVTAGVVSLAALVCFFIETVGL